MTDQYDNIVPVEEGFTDKITNDKNLIDKKIDDNKRIKSGDKNNFVKIFYYLAISLGIAILMSYFGATLVFMTWAISIKECGPNKNKSLFNYIFPTECNEEICKENDIMDTFQKGGNIRERIRQNIQSKRESISNYFKDAKKCVNDNKNIESFCESVESKTKSKFNVKDPGIRELIMRTIKITNITVNSSIEKVLGNLPSGSNCGITFFFGLFFYIVLASLIAIPIIPFVISVYFTFQLFQNTMNFYTEKNPGTGLILLIFLIFTSIIPIFPTLPLCFLYGVVTSIILLFKLMFYPLVLNATDVLFKILKQNMFILRIILIIYSIVVVAFLNDVFNSNIYTGILIGSIPIIIYQIYSLF